jgi:hypothetical protein
VRTALSSGHAGPYGSKLSVLFRRSYALTLRSCADRHFREGVVPTSDTAIGELSPHSPINHRPSGLADDLTRGSPVPVTGTAAAPQLIGLHDVGAVARKREPL